MNLRLAPSAQVEILAILDHVRSESPQRAEAVSKRFDEVLLHIAEFPTSGRRTSRRGMRCVNAHPYPYLVFYKLSSSLIEVAAVVHGARNPRSMPARPR